jgi:hypothetical protein
VRVLPQRSLAALLARLPCVVPIALKKNQEKKLVEKK